MEEGVSFGDSGAGSPCQELRESSGSRNKLGEASAEPWMGGLEGYEPPHCPPAEKGRFAKIRVSQPGLIPPHSQHWAWDQTSQSAFRRRRGSSDSGLGGGGGKKKERDT